MPQNSASPEASVKPLNCALEAPPRTSSVSARHRLKHQASRPNSSTPASSPPDHLRLVLQDRRRKAGICGRATGVRQHTM
eukprot:CAMPEP_0181485032 /NCGR_PEP_ID=MMETSP1110-20121109/46332_1 /TAXON_ID=174948 /ORGANISM="Symbiodinium sp., Strain CCMP421" /LENGTH=79 /DNA_ID=CAMNT_0023610971 /DNA_START=213 /DNA_END=453 /DNA_ORIENTATION=+